MKNFKYIDLFAGIGGLRIPFDELGGNCVFSSEIDKFCAQTYELNFNEKPFGNIKLIKPHKIPEHDLLLAGFPCQSFSNAGNKNGLKDPRGNLFNNIFDILKIKQPSCFLLENVRGLISNNNGRTLKTILSKLNSINYDVKYKVLNSKDFGVPQSRNRVYKLGLNKLNNFAFPEPTFENTRLGDILQKRVKKKYTISDLLWKSHQIRKKKNESLSRGFGYKLFDRDAKYTRTISARYNKDGSEILIYQKNDNPRKLTPLEGLRLQGFPDWYKLNVSDNQSYKQIGNSVSVPVIRAIAKNILKIL